VTGAPAIVAAGPLADPAPEILARFGPVVVAERDEPDTLRALLGEAVGLVARGPTRVGADLLDAAPRLRVIGRSGVGVDQIDLAAATARGIPVVVTPGANAVAMAEGTIALLLSLIKRLPALDRAVREGRWGGRDTLAPGDIAGTTLAVVGYGAIGRRVGELARALGMRVIACDPALGPDAPAGVERAGLDAAIARTDHVSLHVPLTPGTRGLITRDLLARAEPGLNLVNVSRGAVAPLDALLHGLESGALAGVALDVFDPEPPDPGHPLLARPEVICSPHALSLTPAANRAVFRAMSEGMAAVLEGGRAPAVANPAVYEGEAT
jgi:D-3-phosphoglycerate dehydrogenase / 2-oxoglutarate reductase